MGAPFHRDQKVSFWPVSDKNRTHFGRVSSTSPKQMEVYIDAGDRYPDGHPHCVRFTRQRKRKDKYGYTLWKRRDTGELCRLSDSKVYQPLWA